MEDKRKSNVHVISVMKKKKKRIRERNILKKTMAIRKYMEEKIKANINLYI